MLDLTSALYLGLHHPTNSLRPWEQLTTGRPAALASPPGAARVAQQLAALQGCEHTTLAPSTLHLFWDLFTILASERIAIYMDAGTYAIVRWGVEQAAARGVPVQSFRHHDPDALRGQLKRDAQRGLRPVVVADGFCPACGALAPIAAYLENVRPYGGYLVLDDTQALGILGHRPGSQAPYGRGGGGSLRWSKVSGPDVILGSSLAKGFGVPVAVLAGSEAMVRRFETSSATRVHCSPPSIAAISAADHALEVNRDRGDSLRLHLWRLVRRFRQRLADAGLSAAGRFFPVQTLRPVPGLDSTSLHVRLLRCDIRTVLHRPRNGLGACLSFLITAAHTLSDIDRAVQVLAGITASAEPRKRRVQ